MSLVGEIPAATQLLDPAFYAGDPNHLYAELRSRAPICKIKDRLFAVSRHADVRTVMRDSEGWSSAAGVTLVDHLGDPDGPLTEIDPDILLVVDPPRHGPYRRFSAQRQGAAAATLAGFAPSVLAITEEALGRLGAHEADVDLVTEFATPVAIRSIVEVLGLAEADIPLFLAWTDQEFSDADQPNPQQDALGEAWAYMSRVIEDRRENPRDDLLTWLARGEHAGFRLPHRSATAFAIDLLIAGNETTRQAIAGALEALALDPEQRRRLAADPGLLPRAVEELLRWVTPTPVFARVARKPREVSGISFQPGEVAVLLLQAANRDEGAWENADRLDVGRAPTPMHVSFGHGPHFCLGAPLARLELHTALAGLLKRYPDFELVGESHRQGSSVSQGYVNLRARMDCATPA